MFRRLKETWQTSREQEQLANERAKAKEELAKAEKELGETHNALARADDRIIRQKLRIKQLLEGGEDPRGIRPENIIWIFGAARTGSTWLSQMMSELPAQSVWNEPLVGALFGDFYYERAATRIGKRGKHHIMGDGYRESWLKSMRGFVLREISARFPELKGPEDYLLVKEPNGSLGAPLLMEALPESRMILLVRDPRDAVASGVDAWRKGGWQEQKQSDGERSGGDSRSLERQMLLALANEDPNAFVEVRAQRYLRKMEKAKQAYTTHEGRKALIRYEDLRADPSGILARAYSTLEIPVKTEKLREAVEKYAWENVPSEEKGEGKRRRKATPGGWREDLTAKQARIVEEVTRPLLEAFYT